MKVVKRFSASWCAPCKMLAPVLKQLETEFPDVQFEAFDVDENPDEAKQFNIRSVPTVLVMENDTVIDTIVGANPKRRYMEALATS